MNKKHFLLHDVIHDAIRQIGLRGGEKPVWLDIIIDPRMPKEFEGDHDAIRHILLNLLVNAVRCMRIGTLKLLAQSDPEGELHRVSITVADRGKGMTESQLGELFQETHNPPQIGRDEDGLYLYNSRALAREMGGDIVARSWVGVGTDFTLELPLRPSLR